MENRVVQTRPPAEWMSLESPGAPVPAAREVLAAFGGIYLVNAVVAFIFAATGPVAIILAVGTRGGLTAVDLASWIFGAFFLNGLISIALCWRYRQPLAFFWTIPGTVLVGPALEHLTFAEVIGAFIATGFLMLALGFSGWVRRSMQAVPMPIVMGMVAGVFLRFGIDLVFAIRDDFWIAAPMTGMFFALSAAPKLGRLLPPLIGALIVGAVMVGVLGRFQPAGTDLIVLAQPNLYVPAFSWQAMIEPRCPAGDHRTRGAERSRDRGTESCRARATHQHHYRGMWCGLYFGGHGGDRFHVSNRSGERDHLHIRRETSAVHRRYFRRRPRARIRPRFAALHTPDVATPGGFIAALAGLAMLRVLQSAFAISFKDRFTLGALVTFLVTVADVAIFNIGAPFWGLIFGFAVSWLLERDDFRRARDDV